MGKLGYTWYPKDWGNSDKVFELGLEQRGLYRELIDIAMLNNNKTVLNESLWIRKFNSNKEEIQRILKDLLDKDLIEIKGNNLFIPSCEPRLNLSRGGSKGGKKSKPAPKPILKPAPKPIAKQKKEKRKERESNIEYLTHETLLNEEVWLNALSVNHGVTLDVILKELEDFWSQFIGLAIENNEDELNEKKKHFNNTIKKKVRDSVFGSSMETEEEIHARKMKDAQSF